MGSLIKLSYTIEATWVASKWKTDTWEVNSALCYSHNFFSGGAVIKESTGLQPLSSAAGIFLIFQHFYWICNFFFKVLYFSSFHVEYYTKIRSLPLIQRSCNIYSSLSSKKIANQIWYLEIRTKIFKILTSMATDLPFRQKFTLFLWIKNDCFHD